MGRCRRSDGRGAQGLAAAFEFLEKLGMPYYCFHDRDVAPEGHTFAESSANLEAIVDEAAAHQERTGVRLLWGTANLFSHPRYAAGAATNPDPEVFAYAAAQVARARGDAATGRHELHAVGRPRGLRDAPQHRSRPRGPQLARFLHLVAEHKHKIGFEGTLLIEPKPKEPTKHQYDYDCATVHGFLVRNGLEESTA